jgi:hypothetical protein
MSHHHSTRRSGLERSQLESLLDEAARSGLSLAAFARSKGVSYPSLYYARRRRSLGLPIGSRTRRKAEALVPVVLGPNLQSPARSVTLRLPSGLALEVSADFDEILLRRLLGVLGSC